jgi:tRNA (guanine-N7-)-methyltransferase
MQESSHRISFDIIKKRTALLNPVDNTETSLSEIAAPMNWASLFGNKNPVEIEIGCGKGRFLIEASQRRPEINYIGVERVKKHLEKARERLMKYTSDAGAQALMTEGYSKGEPLFSNLKFVWCDAVYFVDCYAPSGSVKAYHVYFPDPWPKRRHRKRRLFRNEIWRRALTRTLDANGGRLYLATDYAEYFYEIHSLLTHTPPLVYLPPEAVETEHIPTSFELKYREQGRKIYRAVYQMGALKGC